MKQLFVKIIACLEFLFEWLTLSPLLKYLKCKQKGAGWINKILLKLVEVLIKVLVYILYFIICVTLIKCCVDYNRKYMFADNDAIEEIVGMPFPELEIISYKKGETNFRGEYDDRLTLKMKEGLSESIYCRLDSIICNRDDNDLGGWTKYNDEYTFSTIWGGCIPAPDVRGVSDDMSFSLSFEKGSNIVILKYGTF